MKHFPVLLCFAMNIYWLGVGTVILIASVDRGFGISTNLICGFAICSFVAIHTGYLLLKSK